MGVTKNTVPAGTELTIEAYQSKDGNNKAVGRNFVLADGKRLFLGGSAPAVAGIRIRRRSKRARRREADRIGLPHPPQPTLRPHPLFRLPLVRR